MFQEEMEILIVDVLLCQGEVKCGRGAPWFYNQEFYDIHSDNYIFTINIAHLDLLKIIAQ